MINEKSCKIVWGFDKLFSNNLNFLIFKIRKKDFDIYFNALLIFSNAQIIFYFAYMHMQVHRNFQCSQEIENANLAVFLKFKINIEFLLLNYILIVFKYYWRLKIYETDFKIPIFEGSFEQVWLSSRMLHEVFGTIFPELVS